MDELFSLLNFLEPAQFPSQAAFLVEFGDLKTETQVEKLKQVLNYACYGFNNNCDLMFSANHPESLSWTLFSLLYISRPSSVEVDHGNCALSLSVHGALL